MAEAPVSYKPRTILVTGGAGFIGSHVVERLLGLDDGRCRVVVLDKLDYCASLRNLDAVAECPNLLVVRGDVCSMDLVSHLLEVERVDTVMHFAAQTHVDSSFGNSLAFTMNNTYGTHVLLEACRKAGWDRVRRFVYVSTDEVYGDTSFGRDAGIEEDCGVLAPTNPYSAAKAAAELLCNAYRMSYGMPVVVTRGNNVYGPRQYPEKLVPKFAILAGKGMPLPVHGDGSAVRSYLYVEDVADAFMCVLQNGIDGETYNISAGDERSVLDVARDVSRLCSEPLRLEFVRDRAFADRRYFIGSDKLAALGWREATGWEDGLRRTIEWYARVDPVAYWPSGDVGRALLPHPHC